MANTGFIKISTEEYKELLVTKIQHENLLDVLFDDPGLSWDKKRLTFNDTDLNSYLKISEREVYEAVLDKLQREDAKKNEEDPNE